MSSLAPLAVQLYSLREAIQTDREGVLRKIADISDVGVEPYGGLDHATATRRCKDLNLVVPSAHLPMPLDDNKNATLDAVATYNIKRIIVPWQPPETFSTLST